MKISCRNESKNGAGE